MRSLLAALFVAAPCIALACSSFTAAEAPDANDGGGGDADIGPGVDGAPPGPGSTAIGTVGTLAEEQRFTSGIAIAGSYVFWIVDRSMIHGVDTAKAVSLNVALAKEVTVGGIGVDGTNVYWLESGFTDTGSDLAYGKVRYEPIATLPQNDPTKAFDLITSPGRAPYTLFAFSQQYIVAGPDALEYAHAFTKDGMSRGGNVYSQPDHVIDHVIVDDVALSYTYDDSELRRTAVINNIQKIVAVGLKSPTSLVSDTTNLYAIVDGNAIVQAPLGAQTVDDAVDGGLRRIATFGSGGGLLAHDRRGSLVLWTKANGTIWLVDIAVGTMTPLATNEAQVTSLAVSEDVVYWTTERGDVKRLTY